MHPHPHPHPYPSRSPYPPLSPATPITPSITSPSPQKQHPPYGFTPSSINMNVSIGHLHPPPPHHHGSRNDSITSTRSHSNHAEYSESESEGEDGKVEKDKLELRREKNRVKQRNLRLRRANHIAELERNLTNIRADHSSLQSSFAHLQQRENNLQGWVHDLEFALFRNGLAAEVETLRRIWADRESNKPTQLPPPPPPSSSQHVSIPHHALPTPSGPPSADPLSTLARAASSMPPGSEPASGYPEARMSYPPPSARETRPTLPRPTSFSRPPFENPYPTPELQWGSQMNEWVQAPPLASSESDKKRKRDPYAADYPPPPPPHHSTLRPGLHPMSGRLSESNIHTLPPIQSYRQTSPTSARPTSAPYQSERHSVPISASTSSGTGNVSPRSIRISDLVSPKPSHTDHILPSLSTSLTATELTHPSIPESKRQLEMLTNREGGWNRRSSSKGDLSVTGDGEGSSISEWNQTPPFEILQTENRGRGSSHLEIESSIQWGFSNDQQRQRHGEGDITQNQTILIPLGDWGSSSFAPIESQGTSAIGWSSTEIGLDTTHQLVNQGEGGEERFLTDSIPHASVYTARILLLSILPQPVSLDNPPLLPDLSKEQQQIILTALSNLSPPEVADQFRSTQLKDLSAEDAKLLLEYQSSLHSDLRLVLFPIAILRAATIRIYKANPSTSNLTHFISTTLREARIFGNPLDPDAWEMPDTFWDQWGGWFPPGRAYCASLSAWRRRDGHTGSTVVEMILGLKGEKLKRREGWVGKPPGWKMPQ
ncbi:hypothetical protein I204_08257 [Kwoniella mangroviensis CBS 8886]|nr:hypothetical protein I204_08257 [Kwoniella mangroviensis CBS 8886]